MKKATLIEALETELLRTIETLRDTYDVDYASISDNGLKYWNDEWDTGEMITGCYLVGRADVLTGVIKQLKGE